MGTLVRFAPELAGWLNRQLEQGMAPLRLRATLQAQGMPVPAAQAIVDAFVAARQGRRSPPIDVVEIADDAPPADDAPYLPAARHLVADERRVDVLARLQSPTLALLSGVLDAEECAALIAMARPRLLPSTIVDPKTGRDVVSAERSSDGMFFRPAENPLIERIDRRLAALMQLPIENGEGLQILRYTAGAASAPHFDFLDLGSAASRASIARSGQRVSTLVCYLNDVQAGGDTVFPALGWSVAPQRGNAVYFEYCSRSGRVDPRTLHAGGRVLAGEKWVATKWMRQRRFVSADGVSMRAQWHDR
ncbi:2OG-Fe(II) oxygenase [Solimonas marina]|uniref:2-oxoglutarate-dependent dioxygenase n=1 Tax=Solimonas marina TaxID=2714601 RepID=A0A969W8V6_9GAMM|nr:2OG-Fe(II) oxygenase [Solimonas marina]NKF22856.1 2-oxoglutarate-dependent dioxygenase [Solimonas marina]